MLELKYHARFVRTDKLQPFNRTMLELKCHSLRVIVNSCALLIAPCWN